MTALAEIASGVGVWPGVLLVAGGVAKARDVAGGVEVGRTALGRLLPDRLPLRAAWGAAGAAELVVGALVVAGALAPWPEAAAALLLAAAALVTVWGVRNAPDAGCGCLGAAGPGRVSWRGAARAGALAALAAVAAAGGEAWWSALGNPVAVLATAAVGIALAWVDPELRTAARDAVSPLLARGAAPARRLRGAVCERRPVSLERTLARLRGSELWLRARPYLAADAPTEHWQEGCWTLMVYPAVYEGRSATAVFAVGAGFRGSARTVAFVDEEEQRVLGRLRARR